MVSIDTVYWFNITIIEWMIYKFNKGLISNTEYIRIITECIDQIRVYCRRNVNPSDIKVLTD